MAPAESSVLDSYVPGALCWFPHQKDGFISGQVTAKRLDGDSVAIDFLDAEDHVRLHLASSPQTRAPSLRHGDTATRSFHASRLSQNAD